MSLIGEHDGTSQMRGDHVDMTVFQGTDYNRKDTSDDINKAANDITGKSSSLCFDDISHWEVA